MEFVVCGVLLEEVDKRWEVPQVTMSVRDRGEVSRERSRGSNFLWMISVRGEMSKSVGIGGREDARGNRCMNIGSVFKSQSSSVRLNVVCQSNGVEKLNSESIGRFLENSRIRCKTGWSGRW